MSIDISNAVELPIACCAPVSAPDLSDREAEATAELFKALADPHRIRIINCLLAAKGQAVCVCDLNDSVDISQPTVSFHLKKLLSAGLVTREQRGTWAYYSIDTQAIDTLANVLRTEASE